MRSFRPAERQLDLRRFSRERPPVVLLGGLNLTRATGLGGIPVVVASADPQSRAFPSRFCNARVLLPPLESAGAADTLMRLGERLAAAMGRRVPLFYGDDDYLNLILQNRERLAQHYCFIVNDPEIAVALLDKERFDASMRSRGLPVPRMLDWAELASTFGPVLVKPRVKISFDDSPVYLRLFGRGGKARVFGRPAQLLADPLACALKDDLILQEYVPGDDRQIWSFHGYADEASRLLAWFIGRKIRTYPALTGASTYLQLAHHEELAKLGHRIVARLPLKGVFKIDFKQDPRDGRFVMLEVNARFNLWHYLAAANGLNIPGIAYEYLLYGRRPSGLPPVRTSVRWLNLRLDYRAYRDMAARGELGLWRWLGSLAFSRNVHDIFAWSDPLPLTQYWLRRAIGVPRATARFTRWLFTAS